MQRLLAVPCKTLWGAEPEELSLLYAGTYVRAAGGLNRLLDTPGGAQESRFVGGPHLVARRVAGELGERVRLEHPAVRIDDAKSAVVLHAARTELDRVERLDRERLYRRDVNPRDARTHQGESSTGLTLESCGSLR